MIWKKIENIYDRIVGYEYGVYPADGSEPVSHDRDIKKYNEVGKIGCRIPTVDEFCIKRIGTCWESANYFASVLPKIVGPQNFRYVYAEWPHNGHVFTHAFTIIRVNKLWYCIDTEEYGRNKKFKDINLETYTDLEDCKEKISHWSYKVTFLNLAVPYGIILKECGELKEARMLELLRTGGSKI